MDRRRLVSAVLRGGYPIAVGLAPERRARGFANLAALAVERVSDDVTQIRHSGVLARFLRLAAATTDGWSTVSARPYLFRSAQGVEVDLVLEADDGRVVAIEVKAGSALTAAAGRGLQHLRDRLGDRFVAGWVLNTGPQAQRIGDRLAVAPVDELWVPG